jgi:hypothetical protein
LKNGNPGGVGSGLEALTFGTIPGLIFTFREKEFLFYDFFWVWGFSLLDGDKPDLGLLA